MIEGYFPFQGEIVKETLKKVKVNFIYQILFQEKDDL
jgi:hypothetical protein